MSRWVARLVYAGLYAGLFVGVLLAAAWVGLELVGFPTPPPRPVSHTGSGFRVERGAQHVVHLAGDPYALGLHNARMLDSTMAAQEHLLVDAMFRFAGSPIRAMMIHRLGLLYLAGLDDYLLPTERLEILGLADGGVDHFPELGPRYGRIAAYHAAHELSHRFAFDSPFAACSLIAVSGDRGADGHAFLARNFDFEGGDLFDQHKIVLAVQRTDADNAFGFVSVAWAGMAGVVSGINERGLAITLNAGASSDYRRVGAPTTLLVRRALERAATVDEAIAILTETPTFISDIIGIADRSGRAVVLELTPKRHGLREGDLILATNHLESSALSGDPVSEKRKRTTTTDVRRRRLERIAAASGSTPLGVSELLAILRDRQAVNGSDLPLGHRHAIDALIATHSVIFDTAGRVWVSEGPHTLGPYHGYDVAALIAASNAAELRAAFLPSLPPDPLVDLAPMIARARTAWKQTRATLERGDLAAAEKSLGHTTALGDHPTTLRLRAALAAARGELGWAKDFLNQALHAPPEYAADTAAIKAELAVLSDTSTVDAQGL